MILVAGGSGRLGTLVVRRLANQGLEVRVVTRDPARAAHLVCDQVQVVTGDVRDRDSLGAATAGVEVVLSAVHGFVGTRGNSPATVDRDGNANLLDASLAAGADVVLMSTVGAAPDSPMELFRMKYAAEQQAAAIGLRATVVRSAAFLELWIDLLEHTAGRSGRPLVFGRGDNRINFVSLVDVAAVVERAIMDPTTRGKIMEIGGPDNLTFNELADAVQMAAGRSTGPRHVPRPVLHLMEGTIGRLKPQLGRQARAALAMDRLDFNFDTAPIHREYPDLPTTSLSDILDHRG